MNGVELIKQTIKEVIGEAEKDLAPTVHGLLDSVKTEVLKVVTMLEDKVEAFEERLKALENRLTPAPAPAPAANESLRTILGSAITNANAPDGGSQ